MAVILCLSMFMSSQWINPVLDAENRPNTFLLLHPWTVRSHLFFIVCFRNHSPLMSFGASFVSFLVSQKATFFWSALLFCFYFVAQVLTKNDRKASFKKYRCFVMRLKDFPAWHKARLRRKKNKVEEKNLPAQNQRCDRLTWCLHELGFVLNGIFIIQFSVIIRAVYWYLIPF